MAAQNTISYPKSFYVDNALVCPASGVKVTTNQKSQSKN